MPRPKGTPRLLRHKASGLAYARFNGETKYFGRWPAGLKVPPAGVREAFERYLSEWLIRVRIPHEGANAAGSFPFACEHSLPTSVGFWNDQRMATTAKIVDVAKTKLIPLSEAQAYLPPSRVSSRRSARTLYDWYRHGVKVRQGEGLPPKTVKLRIVRVAGLIYTTIEWINEFIAAQNPPQPPYSDAETEAILREAGI